VSDGFPKTNELRLPTGVLHQNDLGSIRTNDILGVAKKKGEACSEEHENNEGNVSAVSDCAVGCDVDILSKGNLAGKKVRIGFWKA
jgi:hypothetical protein